MNIKIPKQSKFMIPFQTVNSSIIPLPIKDIDTDMIIPAQYLTATTTDKAFWGKHLFQRLKDTDPAFPLNLSQYKGSQIIVSRENFGSGSSREHAVWALLGWGIRAVIAPSFADIFYNNSGKNGLVLVTLKPEIVEQLLSQATSDKIVLKVDLEKQTVTLPNGIEESFEFDSFRKECILKGVGDLEYILNYEKEIDQWDKKRQQNSYINGL
jgi:3-isopropylmalate/(R)-2-methylmalate dehydratase small subunit